MNGDFDISLFVKVSFLANSSTSTQGGFAIKSITECLDHLRYNSLMAGINHDSTQFFCRDVLTILLSKSANLRILDKLKEYLEQSRKKMLAKKCDLWMAMVDSGLYDYYLEGMCVGIKARMALWDIEEEQKAGQRDLTKPMIEEL
jgi:hypothetical protein